MKRGLAESSTLIKAAALGVMFVTETPPKTATSAIKMASKQRR